MRPTAYGVLNRGTQCAYPCYLCQTKDCCSYDKSIKRDTLEGEFKEVLAALSPSREFYELATEMFRDLWNACVTSTKGTRAHLAAEGKLYLYVGIDRTSKFVFVQLVAKANRMTASAFLVALIKAVPYKIHTVLTDNGIQFTFPPRYAKGPTATCMSHMFDLRCDENGIEHRLTKIKHPWTNGQVERMNRTIKEATVKRYHYESHAQLTTHLQDFIDAYNYGRRLKTLKGLTPFEYICKIWTSEPERFSLNPTHQMPGLNTTLAS